MAEIGILGVKMPTGDLVKGKAALDALVPSATKAEAATEKFNAAANGTAAAASKMAAAAQGAAASAGKLGSAASGAASQTHMLGNGIDLLTGKVNQNFVAINKAIASWNRIPAAAGNSTSALNRLGAAANDNINRLQSTPGNIAAQFQDIGVTAAAGMNPMLIALQQGTQLSSAMHGGIGNLLAGFRQLFSVTTILTVGLVGLAAAGLQMVDWMKVGKSLLHGLASGLDVVARFVEEYQAALIVAAGAALLAFGPQILAAVWSLVAAVGGALVTAISTATMAMLSFALANPFSALVIAIGVVIAAMVALNDAFGGAFTNILAMVKNVANGIIRFFANAFNFVLDRIQGMLNFASAAINSVFGAVGLDVRVGTVDFSGAKVNANREDFVGDMAAWVSEKIGQGADWLRGFAGGLGGDAKGEKKAGRAARGSTGMSELEKIAKAYEDLIAATEKRIAALNVETTALGMSEHAARLYRNEQDLIAQALEKNIPLTDTVRQKLGELAQTLTDAELAKVTAEATKAFEDQQKALKDQAALIGMTGLELAFNTEYQRLLNQATKDGKVDLANMNDEMRQYVALLGERATALALDQTVNADAEFLDKETKAHEERMIAMRREAGEIGLTGAALENYRLETELLIEAQRGIASPETIEKMRQMGIDYNNLTEAVRKQREEIEFHRDTFRGFFEDMIGGLRQGQSVWEAFGNAVLNVVNKIIDRLLDQALDGLFNNKDGSAGGLGGLLGSIGKLFIKPNALGGAYGNSGIERFANGGAFTNGIYNNPTLFKFAKGGALGMMGEAGPEAVMPLKRGPDGSLGVQMHGPQTVNVQIGVNDDRFNAYVDDRSGMQIAAAAPTIASAGGKVAQANMAAQRRRSIT